MYELFGTFIAPFSKMTTKSLLSICNFTFHGYLAPVSDCFRASVGALLPFGGIVNWVAYRLEMRPSLPPCSRA